MWYTLPMKTKNHFACLLAGALLSVAGLAQDLVLAERGKPAVRAIVIAKDAGPSLKYAAEELQRYVKELTGVELVVAGGARSCATVTAAIRLEQTEDYGADGFCLAARPPDFVIRGGVRGCLYGVYELLETYGGVGWYASWRTVVPKLDRFAVPANLDDVQRPAFTMRMTSWLDATRGDFAARLRLNGSRAKLEEKHGGAVCRFGKHMGSCHTFNFLLPAKKYFAEHPEYFAMRDGKRELHEKGARWGYTQPCLTNPDVLRIVTSNVLEAIKADPTAGIYGVSQNDNRLYCQCPACAAVDEEEESHAGTVVRFVNAVAEEVEKHYPNAIIETLAYQYSRKPPKKTRLRHNVMPCLCSIECDFHKPLDVSPFKSNVDFVEDIRGWTRQTDMLYLWDYTTNFRNYLHAFPNIMALQGNLKFFRANNVKYMFEQGDSLGLHADFGELRAWLLAKWMWNPDAPMTPLLDRFFPGYYGAAAPHARKVFDDLYSLPRDSVTQRLGIYEFVTSTNIPTAFFERAEGHWQAAAEAVKGDPECAKNVEAAYLSTMFSLLYRLPRPRTVWVTRHPENFAYDRCRAYAKKLLAARKPFNLRFAENVEREKTFREEIAEMAAAIVPTTGCDRAEVPASRLKLAVPGVRGEYTKDTGTLDGSAIKLFNTHYEWSVRLDLASVAYDPDVTYKVRVRVRVEKEPGKKGEAFWAGVYDTPAKKGRGSISVKVDKCGDGYAWYDVCKWKPRDGQYFWLGPGRFKKGVGVSAIKSVWVDRIEISRID